MHMQIFIRTWTAVISVLVKTLGKVNLEIFVVFFTKNYMFKMCYKYFSFIQSVRCSEKKVKYAYHVACTDCVVEEKVCAKCLKDTEVVEL